MRETWNLCYVGSINAGDLELVLCGFRKCGRLGTCVNVGSVNAKDLRTCVMWVLVLCGFHKCGRL